MTSPRLLDGLRELAAALPAGTPVPVPRELLLELLKGAPAPVQTSATPPADLTVADLALRFGRQRSTVRQWVERGLFPGAYRLHGREWRIPAAGLAAFEEAQRRSGSRAGGERPRSGPVDLGAWRTAS